jgi:hypothetical protein
MRDRDAVPRRRQTARQHDRDDVRWGSSRGGMLAEEEPIQLQGTAYFDGPSGAFVRLFNTRLSPR